MAKAVKIDPPLFVLSIEGLGAAFSTCGMTRLDCTTATLEDVFDACRKADPGVHAFFVH